VRVGEYDGKEVTINITEVGMSSPFGFGMNIKTLDSKG
jgi:hypothetical protein